MLIFRLLYVLLFHFNFSYASELETQLQSVISKHHFKNSELGLYIEEDGKKIWGLNEDKLMIPASLTKIATAATVLSKFSQSQKFITTLKTNAKSEDGKLKGDLCLVGGGDPSFVSEKMWFLVNEFKRMGVQTIEGNLIVDSSRFDDELFDSGRDSVRVDRAFDAPISAMSFNWNSANVFARPGKKVGDKAFVFLDPENNYLEVENNVITKSNSTNVSANRIKVGDHDKIIVSGTIALDSQEKVIYKSISNPNLWSGSQLLSFFNQRNISVKGKIVVGKCDSKAEVIASSPSKSLNEMVADMLKFSNNYVAEMLVKNLGAEFKSQPAKMHDGLEEVRDYLDSIGIKKGTYTIENVSGLTRGNQFTAKQMTSILSKVKNDFQIYPEFLSGLPIAGVDGTLKNRMKNNKENNSDDTQLVRAKTGYLDGVVGLSGFIGRKNKSPLLFAFMFNGSMDNGLRARPLFDELISKLK